MRDRLLDRGLAHRHHVVDELTQDLARELAGLGDRDAVRDADAVRARWADHPVEEVAHRREELRLHTHELDIVCRRPRRDRDAGEESSSAHWYDDHLDVGNCRQDLEADSSLPGDDERVVVGMHERETLGGRELPSRRPGFRDRRTREHDVRAELARSPRSS